MNKIRSVDIYSPFWYLRQNGPVGTWLIYRDLNTDNDIYELTLVGREHVAILHPRKSTHLVYIGFTGTSVKVKELQRIKNNALNEERK